MRVLLSAYSCGPRSGSEVGIGWDWALEVARLGHDVVTLTEIAYRDDIEAEIAARPLPANLRFEFFMPLWLHALRGFGWRLGLHSLAEHVSHLGWQVLAYRYARRRFAGERFDLVHHITYGGIRHPTLMGGLPYPLVLGPLGGGERAPFALRRGYPWGGWARDLVRDLHTWSLRFDPITRKACADALVIYVKTAQSAAALPRRWRGKAVVQMEVGTCAPPPEPWPERGPGATFRALFLARLLYWKGGHLALRAVAEALVRGTPVRLTMAGLGPQEQAWRRLARRLGVEEAIDWIGWVDYDRLGELYRAHDALLFPSLHDASGNAVLGALTHGLPVICLDLGGPGVLVDASCGRVVATRRRSEQACVQAMADALEELAASPELADRLSRGAQARARAFVWPAPVRRVYEDIERRLRARAEDAGRDPSAGPGAAGRP